MKFVWLINVCLLIGSKSYSNIRLDDFKCAEFDDGPIDKNFGGLGISLSRDMVRGLFDFCDYKDGIGRNGEDKMSFLDYLLLEGKEAIPTEIMYRFSAPFFDMSIPEQSVIRLNLFTLPDPHENRKVKPFDIKVRFTDNDIEKNHNVKEGIITCTLEQSAYDIDISKLAQVKGDGVFNLSTVGSMYLSFNVGDSPNDDLAFELDSIDVVPEPFSMLTMGLGCASFVKRMRNKSKSSKKYRLKIK